MRSTGAIAIWENPSCCAQSSHWEDAGFRDLFAGPGLKLCEWPDQATGLMPTADLDITLSLQDDESRLVHLQANTPRGLALLPSP